MVLADERVVASLAAVALFTGAAIGLLACGTQATENVSAGFDPGVAERCDAGRAG